jgi:hypothetical protein
MICSCSTNPTPIIGQIKHCVALRLAVVLAIFLASGSPPLYAQSNYNSLFFQNGASLGILSVNTTFLPNAWQGVGAMNSGWQERAIADINGDGVPDIIFQNGTLLGALTLDASGHPTSWLGIGAMNSGWQLCGAANLTGDGNLDLIFQSGTLLGYLEVNASGVPLSWNGIGAMGAGWQLRAVADLNTDGQPDLIFQNGTSLGVLQVGTNGLPTAWHGIGTLNAGWTLSAATDLNADGQPELLFQNGTLLGALQVNTSFQPVAWNGIGAMGSGWTFIAAPATAVLYTATDANPDSYLGSYAFDSTGNYSVVESAQKDSSGNVIGIQSVVAASVSDNFWVEMTFDPTTGMPVNLNLPGGIQFTFTSFDAANKTATVSLAYNGVTTPGIVLTLGNALAPVPVNSQTSSSAIKSLAAIPAAAPPPASSLYDAAVQNLDEVRQSGELQESLYEYAAAADPSALETGLELVGTQIITKLAKPHPNFAILVVGAKLDLSAIACAEAMTYATIAAPETLAGSYIPAIFVCNTFIHDLVDDARQGYQNHQYNIALQQYYFLVVTQNLFPDSDTFIYNWTSLVGNKSYTVPLDYYRLHPADTNIIAQQIAALYLLRQVQGADPLLPDQMLAAKTALATELNAWISDSNDGYAGVQDEIQYDEGSGMVPTPGVASILSWMQYDIAWLTRCKAASDFM